MEKHLDVYHLLLSNVYLLPFQLLQTRFFLPEIQSYASNPSLLFSLISILLKHPHPLALFSFSAGDFLNHSAKKVDDLSSLALLLFPNLLLHPTSLVFLPFIPFLQKKSSHS